MDSFAPMMVLITAALVVGAVLRSMIVNRRLRDNARVWADLQGKVVDRFGAAPEVVRYLESAAGQRLLAEPTPAASPYSRILDSLHLGLLVLVGGVGLMLAGGSLPGKVAPTLSVVGSVAALLGVGYLASATVSWVLMRRWGLLPAAPAASEDQAT